MKAYSKHKERTPQETVFEIQSILHGIGLFPVLRWAEQPYAGAVACRLTLHPTVLGTNGKGTDEAYASASAYAELMERLQNNVLSIYTMPHEYRAGKGFWVFPDEMEEPVSKILEDPDPFTSAMLHATGVTEYLAQYRFLDSMTGTPGKVLTIPFADLTDRTVRRLPFYALRKFHGSNGMAAGNTMEEAMVQGLSEVFERYVNREILHGRAVPPEIPDEEVCAYDFYHLIEQTRAEGRFRVTLYDCSLGRGFPVAGVCVANLEDNTFGFKLGAHPSFAVAVERTLTEALQGRNMEAFSRTCRAGTLQQSSGHHNVPNVAKTGNGYYPYSLFTEDPDWEWRPWTRWEGQSNRDFLKGMLELAEREGWHVLTRDASFLGFPSCHIVVPGVSHMYPMDSMRYRVVMSELRSYDAWGHFPDLTDDEEERLLRMIRFKESAILDNQIQSLSQRPLSSRFAFNRIGAFLSLKRGEFGQASHFFRLMQSNGEAPDDLAYLRAMALYAKARQDGASDERAHTLVKRLSSEEVARRVRADTSDLSSVLRRQFPRLSCYDCERCPIAGTDCQYPVVEETLSKATGAMRAENVSQEGMLELVRCIMDS